MNMQLVQRKKANEIWQELPASAIQAGCLASSLLRFSLLLLIFLNVRSFEQEFHLCYDGSKEGYRLNTTVIKYVHALTGLECLFFCQREDTSCRSINFRKTSNSDTNCELLRDVRSEKPDLLLEDDQFDHYHFVPDREFPEPDSSNTQTTEKPATSTNEEPDSLNTSQSQTTEKPTSTNEELSSSCKELLQKNKSLSNGVYQLRKNDSLEKYQVYCHMTELSGCGEGGWTLLMKTNGHRNEFNYSSPYWTNKETYAVEDGLEGLNEKQTKLASYWNTPFNKICLGMKVSGVTKWIVIDHQASSLFNVIADGVRTKTTAGRNTWKSLIASSSLQLNCNDEGFNVRCSNAHVRIGLAANNENNCDSCNSYIGFGAIIRFQNYYCSFKPAITCGNLADCSGGSHYNADTQISAFGYILVQ